MTLRRKARELALQLLYQWDLRADPPEKVEEAFWPGAKAAPKTREFAHRLFTGTVAARIELDSLVEKHATNWRLDRMSAIDRNVLRLAVFELCYATAPPRVVMDEAVELARKFSDDAAPAFVNGVLDAVLKAQERNSKSETRNSPGEAAERKE